ncbi:MAG TPA: hypothetical protein VFW78_05305 [Bacteroidia bacterium]|nr:hypothetical protein [Bacteroidia bacterium]
MKILVTSDEPWCEVWHTQLHYANQLSNYFKVIYLNPPTTWKFSKLFTWSLNPKQINNNLTVIEYVNYLPAFLGKLALFINDRMNGYRAQNASGDKTGHFDIVWRFDPMRSFYLFPSNKEIKYIYHVVDPYAGKMLDENLAKSADAVIVTSPKFYQHYNQLNNNVLLVKQGVDTAFYEHRRKQQYASAFNDRVLLLGTLSDDIDWLFLDWLVKEHHFKFLFIGPFQIKNEKWRDLIAGHERTGMFKLLGPKSPEDFAPYLFAAKVGVICYDAGSNPVNNLRSPLKVITYLAAFKPVITNIDCEIPDLLNKGIFFTEDRNRFASWIDDAMSGKLTIDEFQIKNYLQSVSYTGLIDLILKSVGHQLKAK